MKIKVERYAGGPVKFSDWLNLNKIKMSVKERSRSTRNLKRFYASLDNAEVRDSSFLVGLVGDGNDINEAIQRLALELRGKHVVINAYSENRRQADAPNDWIEETFIEETSS